MGCQQSRLAHKNISNTTVCIIDSELKQDDQSLLINQYITPKVFVNVQCLLEALQENYQHNIVITQNDYLELKTKLQKANLSPRIFIISKKHSESQIEERINFFSEYKDLPILLQKHQQTSKKPKKRQNEVKIDVKILKDFKGQTESQLFIFEQTLKIKNITYQFFNNFSQLQVSQTRSQLIVIDYRFHRAAMALGLKSRIICYCDLTAEEEYDPNVFFITNNFQEIVNEIIIQKKLTQPILPISKIFFYSKQKNFCEYAGIFDHFKLKVKTFTNISNLIKSTRLYFSVMLICRSQEKSEVDKKIKQQGCQFRIRVITINDETECSARGLRKVIKQVKRGYMVEKTSSKIVDIIDKYYNDSKFQGVKKELAKNNIKCRCYYSLGEYSKKFSYVAPIIVCNFEERLHLSKFLQSAKIKAKLIVFCNFSKINQQITNDTRWNLVTSNLSKVIKYIKSHHVLFPLILDENQQKLQVKQQNLKNKQNRVSILKMPNASKGQRDFIQPFILTNPGSSKQILKNISYETSNLLKFTYKQYEQIDLFRKNLAKSFQQLRKNQKLVGKQMNLHEKVSELNFHELMLKYRYIISDEREIKLGLNKMLANIQKLKQDELRQIKEFFFLLILNFLGFYQIRNTQSLSLSCWKNSSSFDFCQIGNTLICKNFLTLKAEGPSQRVSQSVKLEVDIQCSPLKNNVEINNYFFHEGAYVFAPYTKFQIIQIDCENQAKVIHLKLIEQNHFLTKYFEENLDCNLNSFLQGEFAKNESLFVDINKRQKINFNRKRLKALSLWKLWKKGQIEDIKQAIKIEESLIKQQEQSDNFDSKLLIELKYELAIFLATQQQKSQQVFRLISQIKQGSPCAYIKYSCGNLLLKLKGTLDKIGRDSSKLKSTKCLQLKQEIQKQSQSQEINSNAPENILYQNLFHCLQIDQKQNYQQFV